MSVAEIIQTISKLSQEEKYGLIKNHRKPGDLFVFPTTHQANYNRSFHPKWLDKHPRMVYSEVLDGAVCIFVPCFPRPPVTPTKVSLSIAPLLPETRDQRNAVTSAVTIRSLTTTRTLCKLPRNLSIDMKNQPNLWPLFMTSRLPALSETEIKKSILQAIIYCGRQCIALHGEKEQLNQPNNPGSLLSLLKPMGQLKTRYSRNTLNHPKWSVSPFFPQEHRMNCSQWLKNASSWKASLRWNKPGSTPWWLMADEVTSHNTEQLALCIRFMDSRNNIQEEVLQFTELERIAGSHTADDVLKLFKNLEIPVENMRGQGYNGAVNISNHQVGVQARIREEAPLAAYIHCSRHCLNLVISPSCSLPEVRNVLDKLKNCCMFFHNSPKRNGLLELVVRKGVTVDSKREGLLDLCRTRWTLHHTAY